MKRTIILLTALCAAVSMLLYCADLNFDNPLDKKGNNYLFGNTDREDEKIEERENGQAGLFDTTGGHNKELYCVNNDPTIKLANNTPGQVTIGSNQPDQFRRWMGTGPTEFVGIVEWSDGAFVSAVLTQGGWSNHENAHLIDYDGEGLNRIPKPNTNYVIVYIATKKGCPDKNGNEVELVARAQRGLIVDQFVQADTSNPRITLEGQSDVRVDIGGTYVDPGVRVFDVPSVGNVPIAMSKIQTIRISDGMSGTPKDFPPTSGTAEQINAQLLADVSKWITDNATSEKDYDIVYHTVSPTNQRTNSVTRRVRIRAKSGADPTPVIVLGNYRHTIGSAVYEVPDTVIRMNGVYDEKGVSEIFYIKSGNDKTTICTGRSQCDPMVTINRDQLNITAVGGSVVSYTIEAGTGYAKTTVNRSVVVVLPSGTCQNPQEPTFRFGSAIQEDPIEVSIKNPNRPGAGTTTWTFPAASPPGPTGWGWSVQVPFGGDDNGQAFRLFVHYGTLDPNNLVVGTYIMTLAGVGSCGSTPVTTTRQLKIVE